MPNQQLARTSKPRSQLTDKESKSALIREWITRLALNAGAALDATALGVFEALWLDGFADVPCRALEAAFRKTLRTAKYWPVKVADVRDHLDKAQSSASAVSAEQEWQDLLEWVRRFYHPDLGVSRKAPGLSPAVEFAARAAGGFHFLESCSESELQWAKKRFLESLVRAQESNEAAHLLSDGDAKRLLASLKAEAPKLTA